MMEQEHDPDGCDVCASFATADPSIRPFTITPAGRAYLWSRRVQALQAAQQES